MFIDRYNKLSKLAYIIFYLYFSKLAIEIAEISVSLNTFEKLFKFRMTFKTYVPQKNQLIENNICDPIF